jgi:hypothetical protein
MPKSKLFFQLLRIYTLLAPKFRRLVFHWGLSNLEDNEVVNKAFMNFTREKARA